MLAMGQGDARMLRSSERGERQQNKRSREWSVLSKPLLSRAQGKRKKRRKPRREEESEARGGPCDYHENRRIRGALLHPRGACVRDRDSLRSKRVRRRHAPCSDGGSSGHSWASLSPQALWAAETRRQRWEAIIRYCRGAAARRGRTSCDGRARTRVAANVVGPSPPGCRASSPLCAIRT